MSDAQDTKGVMPERIPGTTYPRKAEEENQSASTLGRIMLFAGSGSADLGSEIAAELNVPLGRYTRTIFPNENIFIQLQESVRGQDVYVVNSLGSPIHENMFELLIMIDTLKRDSAGRINVVLPYYAYARSDKKDQPRVGIAARLLANLLEVAGTDRYITIDLHAGQIQGFFNIPGDALKAFHLMSDYVRAKNIPDLVVVATDLGFAKKGRDWAEKLGTQLGIIEKRRTSNDSTSEALSLIGEVKGKNVLLVDDEVLTGGSVVNAVNLMRSEGAKDVYLAFTHPVLAGNGVQRLAGLDLTEIITTNTLALSDEK
ncbi:MAG TPA: ribose-phosphate diphosphokinase, partial [Candidatus Limnocylindrales bacterium]|nr:ribose-phosphate diphosphokinase [Candidatus Limnocylindrales bacterium]